MARGDDGRYMGHMTVAAGGVGNESYVELWNPADSDVDIHITFLLVNTKDDHVILKSHTAKQGTTESTEYGNLRPGGKPPTAELYENAAASVSGSIISRLPVTADTRVTASIDPMHEYVAIEPGRSFIIQNEDDNLAITHCVLRWHEKIRRS